MGVVYEAFDETNAVPVALKLLPVVSPDMLLRFKREFRAVADVRHPNLVRLGELVSEGSQWFFSMELVQGVDLMSYVRGVEPPPRAPLSPLLASDAPTPIVMPGEGLRRYDPSSGLPLGAPPGGNYREERLRPALAQLARALAALHAAGAVHRDVKPSNVLVTAEGRAVLLDFGLVSAASIETTQSGAGTPEYMAPEQVAMQPVSGAADWYAFGVILFELLSARLPFEGLPHEILYRKQHGRAPRVAAVAPGVPADLAALCDRLLEPDPELRASGAEVLAALAPAPAGRALDPPAPRDDAVRFVGRERELDAMEAALDAVRAGDGARVLIVRGESGVGKSALVRAFLETRLETNENAPPILLTARCYERELVPFKALDGLVDVLTGLLRQLDADTISRIVPDRAAVLLQAFPVLGRVPLIAHAPHQHVGPDPREVRASMFVVFRQLLRALGERATIVAYVDDLQWADADSLALLSEVLRPPDAPRLLLLGTLRTQAGGNSAGRLLAADVPEEELALSNLGGDAARALARELLLSGGAKDPDRGADVLARESAGHPLFLLELARTAHLRRGNGAHLTLDSVLRAQIESFPEATVRVLRTLAISGAPTPVRMLRRLCDLDGPTAVRLFDELRAARLVHSMTERGDELLDFSHDRIRQVARQSTSSAVARELHEKLAEAFEDASNSLRAGGHWREAGHPDRAAVHFSAAARRAAEALAFDRAIASYTDALALGNWSEEQRQRDAGRPGRRPLQRRPRRRGGRELPRRRAQRRTGAGDGSAAARRRRAHAQRTPRRRTRGGRRGAGRRRHALRQVAGAGARRRADGALRARPSVQAPHRRGDRPPRAGARRSLLVDLVGPGADGSRARGPLPGAQLAAGAVGRRALPRLARHRRRGGLRRRPGERTGGRRSSSARRRPSPPSSITRTPRGSFR